jgi:antitoxin (DNA-binding transcriptional repressor) of toxin-antitoxin stability system
VRLTVTEAQNRWLEVLELVSSGERVEISENETVVAVLIRPDQLRARAKTQTMIAAEETLETLNIFRAAPMNRHPQGISSERVESLTRELREERDNDWSS